MKQLRLLALVFVGTQLLSGCDKVLSTFATQKELDSTRKILSTTQTDLDTTQADLDSTKTEIERLENRLQAQELKSMVRGWESIAYLKPGDEDYSTIHFDLGVLTVQLADVKPYANGSKVNLKFGNTLSASINGLKAEIDWGKVDEKEGPVNESAKTKEVTFTETLRPGSWTTVSVVLDGLPPTELGFVRVHDVAHTSIQLVGK